MPDDASSYNPDDFARLRAVEETHFWFVSRNDLIEAALSSIVTNGSTPSSVLDIGCGTGNTLGVLRRRLPQAAIVGIDPFRTGLLFARRYDDVHLVQGQVERLPFQKPFSLIGMFDVLEHMANDITALRGIREVLEPGAPLLMTVPAGQSLWSRYDEESGHFRRYHESQLRNALEAAGFRIEYLTHFMTITYPVLWISRRADRWRSALHKGPRRAPAIERELRLPQAINRLFREILRVETAAVRRRRRLPFGASLFAIART